MIMKTVIEVAQGYTDFNYIPPRTNKYVKYQCRKIVAGTEVKPKKKFYQGTAKRKLIKTPPQMH